MVGARMSDHRHSPGVATEMRSASHPHPAIFLLLSLPKGVPGGFIVVMLPFLGRRAGIPVATIASMVAIGLAPKVWRVLWAPVADLRLTLKAWYRIGAFMTGGTLLALGVVPIRPDTVWLVSGLAFLSEVGSSFVVLAVQWVNRHGPARWAQGAGGRFPRTRRDCRPRSRWRRWAVARRARADAARRVGGSGPGVRRRHAGTPPRGRATP